MAGTSGSTDPRAVTATSVGKSAASAQRAGRPGTDRIARRGLPRADDRGEADTTAGQAADPPASNLPPGDVMISVSLDALDDLAG